MESNGADQNIGKMGTNRSPLTSIKGFLSTAMGATEIEDSRAGRAWRHVVGPKGDLFEAAAIREGSWLVYHYGLSNLERYCAERDLVALPAEPETLKAWIRWMSDEEELSAKTIATYVSGVGHSLRAGMVSTTADRRVPLWKMKERRRGARRTRISRTPGRGQRPPHRFGPHAGRSARSRPLPAPAQAPTAPPPAPPPAAQPASAMPQVDGLEIAKANMLPLFHRLGELIGGELTLEEAKLVNRVAWQFGRQASDVEIEAVAQRLAREFEPASAAPLMHAESS
jgi:hypothetical protein